MRFATQVLLLQLACVVAVVAACTAVFAWLGVQQLRDEAESTALGIARSLAVEPDVREAVAAYSAQASPPTAASLENGPLRGIAAAVELRTEALFVVITDDRGIRLAHPDPSRLGEPVSTSPEAALSGHETVAWERGTLGESARAKVPVYGDDDAKPVGEVSVGFAPSSVFADLPGLVAGIGTAVVLALLIGAGASALIRRRLERATLGLQPEELAALVQNQAAVLDGVGDGVIAWSPNEIVRVCNAAAERMLRLDDPVGASLDGMELPPQLLDALRREPAPGRSAADVDAGLGDGIVVNDRVVYVDTRRVRRGDRDLGTVAIVRDRTDLMALAERLEAVRATTNALRAQRHEFANRLHVAAGLIDADRVTDARSFLDELMERGPVAYPLDALAPVDEPFLQAFLGSKSVEAAERGVTLRIADDTLVLGVVARPEDVAAVLGNLVDNAVSAAVDGPEPRWVEVSLLDDGDELAITVADSGRGVVDPEALFARRASTDAAPDVVRGHGVGLPLSRELARRLGGDVKLVDAGGDGHGAVLAAQLPHVMTTEVEA
ncbi:sensor histidine kinase [Agromyces sp. ISL-38]|uniref:sensor histidine kinase n=1 Tax=Agromyces sp. ISL-38 TaxID=2819107 RepID=UPI0027E09D88|nr:sensor histidine kinase [Agromyces sp. ISL-38]